MKNPWIKKNPFLSMWLSSANAVGGAARSQASAAVRREATKASRSATREASAQIVDFWGATLGVGLAKPRKRRRR
jgi:hypothetical protein